MSSATAVTVEENPRFRKIEPIGYALGDIGNGFYFQLISNYALIYLTDAMGVGAGIAGAIIFGAKIFSAFTDFGFGRASDHAKMRKDGRYHWFIKVFRYPLMITMVLFFIPQIAQLPVGVRIAWCSVLYLLTVFFYSAVSAPYGSIASVSTPVVKHRDAMASGRGFGSTAGGIVVGFILPLLVYKTVNGQKTLQGGVFIWIALVFIVLMWLCYEMTLRTTVERIRIETAEEDRVPLTRSLKMMFSNRAMVALVVAALLLILTQLFASSVNNYLYKDYFNNTFALSILAFQNVPALIIAPFAPAICDRFGKKAACGTTLAASAVMFLVMFFLHITNPWVFVVLSFIANLGNGFFGLMVWSFITDITDDIQVKTHTREDGTIYTGYMFFRKIGQALSGLIAGAAVAWTGYVSATAGETIVQSQGVLDRIYTVATVVPAVGYALIAAVLLLFYPLSGKIAKENAEILAARKAKGQM